MTWLIPRLKFQELKRQSYSDKWKGISNFCVVLYYYYFGGDEWNIRLSVLKN